MVLPLALEDRRVGDALALLLEVAQRRSSSDGVSASTGCHSGRAPAGARSFEKAPPPDRRAGGGQRVCSLLAPTSCSSSEALQSSLNSFQDCRVPPPLVEMSVTRLGPGCSPLEGRLPEGSELSQGGLHVSFPGRSTSSRAKLSRATEPIASESLCVPPHWSGWAWHSTLPRPDP